MGRNSSRKRRTAASSFASGRAAKRSRLEWSETAFGRGLSCAGLSLSGGAEAHVLSVENAVFQRKLASSLKRQCDIDQAVQQFTTGMADYLEDPVRFRACLLPIKTATDAVHAGDPDSLIRLLLGVESLQPSVAMTMVQKMSEFMEDDDISISALGVQAFHRMAPLILSQLRWMDQVVRGEELCAALLEVVSVAPVDLKRLIVTSLPDILDDSQHGSVAKQLRALLEGDAELTAAVLDALSNLNLSTEAAAEVLDVAISSLSSARVADLPALLKFIMQQVTSKRSQAIISEVRELLDFESTFLPQPAASSTPLRTPRHSTRISAEASHQYLVFDAVRSSISVQRPVAEGWMKAIECVQQAGDHKVIDVFVLIILHSTGARRKTVEALFCSKIKAGLFTRELLAAAFGPHAMALREYFPSMLALCERLLCSPSLSVSSLASCLYLHLFRTFDVYCQQEVIGSLITHVGSGTSSDIDRALATLGTLVEARLGEVRRFAILIKGVLDYLEHLSVAQVRCLYSLLSSLAFGGEEEEEGSSLQDELHTVVRKQLAHPKARYRHMGVIGAVRIIQQLARCRSGQNVSLATQTGSLAPEKLRQAISMLDDVMHSFSSSPDTAILFSDEMAAVVGRGGLATPLLQELSEKVTTAFQDSFLVDSSDVPPSPSPPSSSSLAPGLALGLDSAEEGCIALNLAPLLAQDSTAASVRAMHAQFRLLRVCEQHLNGCLEGIDALLGCPVVMVTEDKLKADVLDNMPAAKCRDVCLSVFHCLNWFQELVCAFAGEKDGELRGKVVQRLGHITQLREVMERCMAAAPGFIPPCVNCEEAILPPPRAKRGKGGKGDATLASVTMATQMTEKEGSVADKAAGSIDKLKPCFRELDLGVFAVLHYGPSSPSEREVACLEPVPLRLGPAPLLLLLSDLSSKLGATLSAFRSKSAASGSAGCSAHQLVGLMASLTSDLCQQLETTCAFFQARLTESDGIVDLQRQHKDFDPSSATCLLLLRCLATFFAWPSLADPAYEAQLTAALRAIGTHSQSPAQAPPQLAEQACKYLRHFTEFLPSLSTAHWLAKLLVAICKTCRADKLRPAVAETCSSLLKQSWPGDWEGGDTQGRNDALEWLLRYHVEWSADPLATIEAIAGEAVPELLGQEAAEESHSYPTLRDASFPIYYRSLMRALVVTVKGIPPPPHRGPAPSELLLLERMESFELSSKLLLILMNLIKSFDKKSVLSTALKYGRIYVDAFVRSGMPTADLLFRAHKDDVLSLLKTLQQSTRYLHHLCGHSKVAKDISLTNHVPQLKKSLEVHLFKVKEMLTNHNCLEAFWVGNLKNRDLQGQEISSQPSQASQASQPSQAPTGGHSSAEVADDNSSSTTERRDEDLLTMSSDED